MSLADISMFYILGEDSHHRSFIRAWLDSHKISYHRVHVIEPPAGKGGGWNFVLEKCLETIKDAQHRNRVKGKTRVIIVIDADDGSVGERIAQINKKAEQIDGLSEGEIVCTLVPKRDIETWVHALVNPTIAVDEQSDYKEKTTTEVKGAARALARLPAAPQHPPSLAQGYEAFKRLKVS
jgi:hypothetical protein